MVARPIGAGKECNEQRPAVGGDERGDDVLARPGDAVREKAENQQLAKERVNWEELEDKIHKKAGEVGNRKSAETGEPTA